MPPRHILASPHLPSPPQLMHHHHQQQQQLHQQPNHMPPHQQILPPSSSPQSSRLLPPTAAATMPTAVIVAPHHSSPTSGMMFPHRQMPMAGHGQHHMSPGGMGGPAHVLPPYHPAYEEPEQKLTKAGLIPKKRGRKSKSDMEATQPPQPLPPANASHAHPMTTVAGSDSVIPTTVLTHEGNDIPKKAPGRRKKVTPLRDDLPMTGVGHSVVVVPTSAVKPDGTTTVGTEPRPPAAAPPSLLSERLEAGQGM